MISDIKESHQLMNQVELACCVASWIPKVSQFGGGVRLGLGAIQLLFAARAYNSCLKNPDQETARLALTASLLAVNGLANILRGFFVEIQSRGGLGSNLACLGWDLSQYHLGYRFIPIMIEESA